MKKTKTLKLRPLKGWIVVQPLSPDDAAAIGKAKTADAAPAGLITLVTAPRQAGEQPEFYRWCKVLATPAGYDDVAVGDTVFCNTMAGSHGVNNDYQTLDGIPFLQMPTKDVMGVLE